jgi:hypothetical protein
MRRCAAAAALIVLSLSGMVHATTVIAPSFEELIAQADVVFEGEVIDTRARISPERDGSPIVTDVYFRVAKVMKGTPSSALVLQFLGGEVGDLGFRVDGVPTFAKGDRDVIFADTTTRLVSPIVGMMHGRVRITADGAGSQEIVRLFDGRPLRETGAFGAAAAQPLLAARPAMSLAAFESAVVAEVARQAAAKGRRP